MALNRVELWLLLFFIASSVSRSDSPKQIEQVAEQAVAARQKLMQEDATAADVDAFLAFGTDDLIYEDPVVKMKIEGRDQIRKGMLAFLGVSRSARVVVTKRITVANVVVFEQVVSFEEKQQDNRWKPLSRHQVTIFEFEGSKIRRIADYWSR
jgi:ketosteroid isomerase-like protein